MIRIPQVRVVDEEGAQLGVMPTPQALAMAQERGLDLVEVAPMAAPPVVKFLDFGQYKYELTKREKENKRRQRSVTFKEVRLSPKIGSGDFETKVHRAIEFLEDGDRIKVTVRFRGRELTHPELGRNMLARFTEQDQGTRRRRTGAAARGQVDAPHGRIDPQAEGARAPAGKGRRQPASPADAGAAAAGRAAAAAAAAAAEADSRPAAAPAAEAPADRQGRRPSRQQAPAAAAGGGHRPTAPAAAPATQTAASGRTSGAGERTDPQPRADEAERRAASAGSNRRVRPRCRR